MPIESILGPGGAIAERLGNYEERPQQVAMAQAVAEAIAERQHLMVEAGTGVGKSFAYLVPAIQAALADEKCRVVVSTHTISLQEQLIQKDIPFLQKVLPEFKAVLVKGRSNYLSLRRLRVARQRAVSLLGEADSLQQLDLLEEWAKNTSDGSKSDLTFQPLPSVWDLAESDSDNCLGKKCRDYDRCFYFKARRQVFGAHLMVVNHAIFFIDLMLKEASKGKGVLPEYQVAILDEAHTLEDVASEHLGLLVTRAQVEWLLNKLFHERNHVARGLLSIHGSGDDWQHVEATKDAATQFFNSVRDWRREQEQQRRMRVPAESLRVRQRDIVPDVLSDPLASLVGLIDRVGERVKSEEEKIELDAAAKRCSVLADNTRVWLEQGLDEQVYWVDVSDGRKQRVSLASAPIDLGPTLRRMLFERVPTVILTSATLSTGGEDGFAHLKHRLGFPDHPRVQLGSPFNYREQVELHLFRRMPEPSSPEFEEACLEKIREYVLRTQGRAFVLFTSTQTMSRAAEQLRGWMHDHELRLLAQSDGRPPAQMLREFTRQGRAVLFGVDSFWQGVDVQGEALSNVIITKLPFVPPDRPVVEARVEAINRAGGYAFYDYTVPQAVIKLKQGFGRLIRTKTDTGLVAILDPRVLTKSYGRWFLDALPPCRRFIDGALVSPE